MKKLAILTSILALAACGGGGGSSGSAIEQAASSNAKVTGMYTTIETTADGSNVSLIGGARRATTLSNGNIVYDLEDVDFLLADEDVGEFKFTVDENKKIIGFVLLGEEDDPEDEDKVFTRPNKDNKFYGQTDVGDSVLTYTSMGKGEGLRYSDFGNFDIDVIENWRPTFIGGYEVKKISTDNIITDTTPFTGHATGFVMAVRSGEGSGKSIPLNGDASLVFNNGDSTLNATFDNWYDIKYTSADNNVVFTNGDDITDSDFYLINDTTGVGGTVSATEADLRYYGDNNKPSEAVGLIQVRDCGGVECNNDYDTTPEVRMNMAFGVKK